MSSAICQNFVQNAWKKELCSNCFKSKDEHAEKPKPKPIHLISTEKVEGIIRNGKKIKPKLSVCFLKDLTEIIGYGGEDWCSANGDEDEEEDNDSSDDDATMEADEDESTKELKRITKENTDFNTTSLADIKEVKKPYTQLLLGKPLVDASGKKQTLLVSVTPFGEDSSSPVRKFNTTKSLSHIPIAKNNKDIIAENKTNVVLTSYSKNEGEKFGKEEKSLLDEISETLEKSKNPIQIMAKKKIQKDLILPVSDSNKENISQEAVKEKEVKKVEVKEEEIVLETKAIVTEKKISLSRTPALKRDVEKPVIFQTTTAKIELLNTKNLKLNKETVNKAKTEVNNNEKSDSIDKKSEKNETTNNIISTTNLIKAEILNSRSEISESKEKKDEINTNVAEKSSLEEKSREKVTGLPPLGKYNMPFPQSREQAGKPDGREDPVATELPPLPITPPPTLETQTSFLHSAAPPIYEKPKVPSKPATVLIRKPPSCHLVPSQPLTTFNNDKPCEKLPLCKQDSNDSDSKTNKRRAPKPPPEEAIAPVYTRHSTGLVNIDSPVVREKEKRERASSCTPKILGISDDNVLDENSYVAPEPAPRKSLSVSTDSLTAGAGEEKKKEKHRGRFSLKKFLRMGSSKDLPKVPMDSIVLKTEEPNNGAPQPKPRLVIVHPSELNGAKVEVVAKPMLDQVDFHSTKHEYSMVNGDYEPCSPKATKPPPPPRNFNDSGSSTKPNLPHPPKSVEILNKQRQISRSSSNTKKTETVYANIGEVRSAMVPNKPVRTASMREREAQQQKQLRRNMHNYEPINVRGKDNSENVYDYINSTRSSSPDSDSSRDKNSPKNKTVRLGKRSESSIDVSGDYFKYSNIPRSMSLTYCGSETESEIYAPYSFYGSESEVRSTVSY